MLALEVIINLSSYFHKKFWAGCILHTKHCVDFLGLLDMLSRAQGCRADDQRGPLTKEQLEMPSFLLLRVDEPEKFDKTCYCSTTDPTDPENADNKDIKCHIPTSGGTKDMRETDV